MKIKDNRQNLVDFKTLKDYDTFCYVGDFCMKIPALHDGCLKTYNIFRFNNNTFDYFIPEMEVLPVHITLKVS